MANGGSKPIAIDLIPLAVLKQTEESSLKPCNTYCNRPHTACGIETPHLVFIGRSAVIAIDLIPLAVLKHMLPLSVYSVY